MRILSVTETYAPFYEFGGPPTKVEALARGLAGRGHEVSVVTADWGVEQRVRGSSEANKYERTKRWWVGEPAGVRAYYLPTVLRYRTTSWNPGIKEFVQEELGRFDVIHVFGMYDLLGPSVARACREKKIPYVVEPIGMFVPIVRNLILKKIYHSWIGKKMLSGAARIIATSEQEMNELEAGGIARDRIVLRRNGVMKPQTLPEKGVFRKRLRLAHDAFVILFLGRLSQKKSPDLLLRAFSMLPSKTGGRPVHLVFAGPDEHGMKAKLTGMTNAANIEQRVHFVGAIFEDEKWAAYQDADVFVLPSQNENFGNTAAEAAAIGTPVVVTENCGVARLLAEGGIIIRHDEQELTLALTRLLENETMRGELARHAAIAASNIGWDEPVKEMEWLYRALAEKR